MVHTSEDPAVVSGEETKRFQRLFTIMVMKALKLFT